MSPRPHSRKDPDVTTTQAPWHGGLCYQIRIRGRLGRTLRAAFPALHAQAAGDDTVLTGTLADQAALFGVLHQIEALGLELLEVRRLPGEAAIPSERTLT
jgi:hypothetical protein